MSEQQKGQSSKHRYRPDFHYDPQFLTRLRETVRRPRGGAAIRHDPRVVDFLVGRLQLHFEAAMDRHRGSEAEALDSAARIMLQARRFAVMRESNVVSLSDVTAAYRRQFCTVWPFC